MPPTDQEEAEARLHQIAIQSLAQELRRPVEFVRVIYEREYLALKRGARVNDFISVFAARRARRQLRDHHP